MRVLHTFILIVTVCAKSCWLGLVWRNSLLVEI